MGVNLPGECQVGMFCGCLYGEKKKPQAQTCGEEGVMEMPLDASTSRRRNYQQIVYKS